MAKKIAVEELSGVWSAAPTPFTDSMKVDTVAVKRMVEHHLRLGVKGLFVAGTNGEGPWMPDAQRRDIVRLIARHARGRLPIAVQVTDNSVARILDNIKAARDDGGDIAVIASPNFLVRSTPKKIEELLRDAIRRSPLPVGFYDRGTHSPVMVPNGVLKGVYGEPNVIMLKDSSSDPERRDIALAARRGRPELRLLDGDEFHCVDYLKAGYDGLLLGGGVFNGHIANLILEAMADGDIPLAERLQKRMNRIMWAVYGGKSIKCWIAGEKRLLVAMGVFRTEKTFLQFRLTDACGRAIERVLDKDADVLTPWKESARG